MSDFTKTILTILLTTVLSSVATTSKLSAEIENIDEAVAKIDSKIERIEERVRLAEIAQASYLAVNTNNIKGR